VDEELIVTHSLRGEGFDASEDGSGRGTPLVPITYAATDYESGAFDRVDIAGPLTTSADRTRAAPIAFSAKDHGAGATDDLSPTLRAGGHAGSHANAGVMPAVAFQTRGSNLHVGDVSGTMGTTAGDASGGAPMVAFSITPSNSNKDYNAREVDKAQALTAGGNRPSARGGDLVVPQPYTLAIRGRGDSHDLEARQDGTANALLTPNGGRAGIGVGAIALPMMVRRLTPKECARLQGFADDYLDITFRGKPAADGNKYRALGNSWAVPVVRWIGERIDLVEAIHAERLAA
jgi:DNA (cytosine-5)-methyltransferase 1